MERAGILFSISSEHHHAHKTIVAPVSLENDATTVEFFVMSFMADHRSSLVLPR